jgi:phenylacetate-coenzyme A ligase PaaK-like adenylate-forming protein
VNHHFWQGTWVDDAAADRLLDTLEETTQRVLAGPRLNPLTVLAACDSLTGVLAKPDSPLRQKLSGLLGEWGVPSDEIARTFDDLLKAFDRGELERKITEELGGVDPARLGRLDFHRTIFEAWVPVGLLAHIAAGNAPAVGALSTIEGLLAGNLNIVKTSGGDSNFTAELLAGLAEQDPTGRIAERVIVLRYPSSKKDWLERMCAPADAVAAWGGEEALAGIAEFVRPGTRLIDWGPKLSFAYLTADAWSSREVLHGVAADICRLDQQACSSPQVIYLDTEDTEEVFAFAERFAAVLAEVVPQGQPRDPSEQEWAEITNTALVAQLEEHLGLTKVITAEDGSWRVMADTRSALRASPLYRSVWVKPLPRKDLIATLRPMRRYLQTAGVGASRPDTAVLARALVNTGVQRVTVPGEMLSGYAGEPHDGVYALQRYSRRVDVQLDERFRADTALDDFVSGGQLPVPAVRVTRKEEFDSLQTAGRGELFFLSGGSSGKPKTSAFTWADYAEHMSFGAESLITTGLDPRTDRVMNLFFGGHMYGSFISFFSALEKTGAVQFPMGGEWGRLPDIAQSIVDNQVDTLMTVPSFVMRLFTECGDTLRRYRGVRKIFYAGEHFGDAQVRWLHEEFGIELIRSAAYSGVDAGPLGYQCPDSPNRVHHLFTGLQSLEILDAESDTEVPFGEAGRLVFTAHTRRGQRLDRYEIGDLGRWVGEPCACGRRSPRFELLGRVGDVFRIAAQTMNYRRFVQAAEEAFGYSGALQLVLTEDEAGDILTLRMEPGQSPEDVRREFLARYDQLAEAVDETGLLRLVIDLAPLSAFDRTASSGKLIAVAEKRSRSFA